MPRREPVEFRIGDRLQLRKPHPCGGYQWTVVRLGADIGIRCESCGRRVLLARSDLERRIKKVIEEGPHDPVEVHRR
ncbi:MAG TPA: DUF951 domain-containing protein [Chloroflexota bacterium]|nr:DUF951 domain-containing protein [Chloroflexota bacterium]